MRLKKQNPQEGTRGGNRFCNNAYQMLGAIADPQRQPDPSLTKKQSFVLLNLFKTLEEEAKRNKLRKIQNLVSEENKNKWKKVHYEGNNETCLSSVLFLGTEYLTSNQTKLSESKTSLRRNT